MSDERYTKIVFPIVNMNGDKKETLTKQLQDLYEALSNVSDKLGNVFPHGRNYQCNDQDDYFHARAQHDRWLEALNKILKEVQEQYYNIYDQEKD